MRADHVPQASSTVQAQFPSANHGLCATAAPVPNGVADCGTTSTLAVSQVLPHRLTDDEREAAIERAGVLIYRYMGIWERTGCFAARGDADRARRLMEQLIAGRSAEQVLRMERALGLDMPACANEARRA